ncbi:family 10 glycosylhydrolase [Mycolicibacterium tokaiense]|uniref:Uncharacterized protein conserved in bacteria n=1 Tax=Mycolicibacterium tokaiense TaxID=39695 RepID=A0A378TDI9_9MYCO|nr:family 10 glycosylhydrolase [Mycolicibacterium tokaiense]STZ58237.1 Uncharacterized protein conserved in bacteria [Mycolicibacterium tokaiense]
MNTAKAHFSQANWWASPFAMFQTNLREVDATMDVGAVADAVAAFGADTWLVNGGGIMSFYPTDLPFQTRNPFLDARPGGDLLGDAVEAAHARGLRLLARMDFSKVSQAIADAHPQWCFVGPDGRRQVYNGLVSVCPSAGYYQEKIFEVIDEVLDRYDIDGFFFNWLTFNEVDYSGRYWGVSQNASSKAGFAEFSGGLELPTGPDSPHYDLWRRYSSGVIQELTHRINTHIRGRRPNVGLIRSDIVFYEANNEVGRELWHHATGEAVSAFRSREPQRPVVVNSVAFIDMPYRLAGEQPQHFAQYLLQAMARGANPSTYIMGVPGDIPNAALESAGEIVRFHRDHRAVYTDLGPGARVGLVRPDRLAQDLARHEQSTQEFRGLYAALQQAHIAFDVLPAEGIAEMNSTGGLRRYRLLVIPDVPSLPTEVIAALDTFVDAGGRVALTGRSGFGDTGHGVLAATPAIRITDAVDDAEQLKSTYVTAADQVADGVRFGASLVPVYGVHYDVELRRDADTRGSHLARAPFGPPEKAYGNQPDGQPAFVLGAPSGALGGRVGLVPWTIGRSFHELGLTSIRDTFLELVHELAGDDLGVTAQLPEQAEITVQQRPDLMVVHVLNLSGARRKSFGPEIDISDGRLIIPMQPGAVTVRSLVTESDLATEWDGGRVVVRLPKIGLYDVITIAAEETP